MEQERAKYASTIPDLETEYKKLATGGEFALPATGEVVVVVDGGMEEAIRYVKDNYDKTAVTMPIFEWDEIKLSPSTEAGLSTVSVKGYPEPVGVTGDEGALLKSLNKIQ